MKLNFMGGKDDNNNPKSRLVGKIINKNSLFLLVCLVSLVVIINAKPLLNNISRLIPGLSLTANVNSSFKLENLGVQFQALTSGNGTMFFDANNDPHWFVVYSNKAQFFDVNLKTGEKRYFDTGKSGLGTGTKALSGNKLIIVIGDTCSIWEYDISAGSFKELKQSGSSNGCGNATGGQSSYTAPDGMVYIGTAHRSTILEIDPSDGKIRDFGIIDPPTGNPTCNGCASRQIANIVADAKYVYALMRDTGTNSYWLAIVNRTDGSLSASCEKDDNIVSGKIAVSVDGSQIWYNSYRVDNTNGQCPTTKSNPPALKPWFYPSNVYFTDGDSSAQASSVFGADIDDSDMQVDTSTGGNATLSYRYPAGSGNWTQATQKIKMLDSKIKRIKAKDDSSMYLVSGTYGPNSVFDGKSNTMLGRIGGQSTYAVTPVGQYVYFSGYTATTYRYTPTLPWSITGTGTTCSVSSPSNPCLAFAGMGKYHYYSIAVNDMLYIASSYYRGIRAGGDIGWINSKTGSTGSHAFTCDSPTGFALLSDGTTLAYTSEAEAGSFGCTNTEAKLFIFDTKTNTVKTSFAPVAGSDEQGIIIGTNDGDILGIIKDFPSNGQYTMYKVSPSGQHASWSPITVTGNMFGGSGQGDRQLVKAHDGIIYTWDSAGVVKIDPTDGSRSSFVSSPTYITAMEFVGEDLYMATNPESSIIKRIPGLNKKSTTPSPTLSKDKSIKSFDFKSLSPNINGTVDDSKYTISLSVPFGTNITALSPTISITGQSISPNTGVAQDFTNPVTYTVTAEDSSTQKYTASVFVESKKPVSLSSNKSISSFYFNKISPSVKGSIDSSKRTIALNVPYGTNITTLAPTISITGDSINPKNGVSQNFTKPVTYTVTAEDGSTQTYTVSVKIDPKPASTPTPTPVVKTTPPPINNPIPTPAQTEIIKVNTPIKNDTVKPVVKPNSPINTGKPKLIDDIGNSVSKEARPAENSNPLTKDSQFNENSNTQNQSGGGSSRNNSSETKNIVERFIESYSDSITVAGKNDSSLIESSPKIETYFENIQSLPKQPIEIVKSILLILFWRD
jgi:hypothetical protein